MGYGTCEELKLGKNWNGTEPEEIVANLRRVELLTAQAQAIRSKGVTEVSFATSC
jgi:hypothetical protein